MSHRVGFFGTPSFAAVALDGLLNLESLIVSFCVTQPYRPAGRGKKVQPTPVGSIAEANRIPLFQPGSLRKEWPALRDEIAQLGPFDVFVVAAFGQILPIELLHYPRCGSVNIHASLLPRWRGAAPIHRAIEAGDTQTGVCLMAMDAGLDTGPVYSSARCPIAPDETTGNLHDTLALLGKDLLLRDLSPIIEGKLPAVPQPVEGVTYAKKFTADDARLDWGKDAQSLLRTIRASCPAPGAFSFLDGKRFKVLRGAQRSEVQTADTALPVGTVVVRGESIAVRCKDGWIELEEVQLEGARRMTSSEFLRGTRLSENLILVPMNERQSEWHDQ